MKSILITGGTGAFGQAFTQRLLEKELADRICIYSRGEYSQYLMRQRFKNDPRLRFFIGDVRDRWRLARAFHDVDTVVHAAALKRIEALQYNPTEGVKTNVLGAINVVEAAADSDVKKVIFLSSDKAYQPISPYGYSKALAECIFLAANSTVPWRPQFSVCRYGNVWRSTGSVVPLWEQQLKENKPATITDPECTRFFMRMSEAVDLVLDVSRDMPTEVAIPVLPAYRLGDLAEAMGASTVVTGLPAWEKQHESMDAGICSRDVNRMTVEELRAEL